MKPWPILPAGLQFVCTTGEAQFNDGRAFSRRNEAAKCEYCGRYGELGQCEGCGAPNRPYQRIDITGLSDRKPRYISRFTT